MSRDLPKKTIQDTSYEICNAASHIQIAISSANLAAQSERPHDTKQCLTTVRHFTSVINMHIDDLEEMMPR